MTKKKPAPTPERAGALKEHLVQGSAHLPHLSELAEHFIRLRGGPQAVAEMLIKEWEAAPAGSIARARILEMLLRTWKVAEEKDDHLSDLGLLTKEDLDREIDERLTEMLKEPAVEPDPSKPRWPQRT